MSDMTVPNTIVAQLGWGTLHMLGAKDFAGDSNSLQFSIMRNSSKVNKIVIRLDPDDTYTVEFWKVGRAPKYKMDKLHTFSNVYYDDLHDIIRETTKLNVTIPKVKGINC